ncbi:MAG: hypothetical protein WC478_01170 [Candidatus Omnitrophota bacterium]
MPTLTAIWAAVKGSKLIFKIISFVAIIIVVVGVPILVYRAGYNKGWKNCALSRPTNTYNGPTTVIQAIPANVYGITFGKHWGIGIVHQ